MQNKIVRERLEAKLEILKGERDAARLKVSKLQGKMKLISVEIRDIKAEEKKELQKKKRAASLKKYKPAEVSKNAVLNIDPATRVFLEENIYSYRGWKVGDPVTSDEYRKKLHMGLVRIWFRDKKFNEVLQKTGRPMDVGREVYIINETAKGASLKEMGKELSVSRERVRQILCQTMKTLRHPKVARKFIKDDK